MPSKPRFWGLGMAGVLIAIAAIAASVVSTGGARSDRWSSSKFTGDPDAAATHAAATPGEGPIDGYEAYLSAQRTYPANVIPPSFVQNAKATFEKIAKAGDSQGNNHWDPYGPVQNSIQPGVLSFSGADTLTASRMTALVVAPTCVPGNCRLWAGSAGGGVWRTNDALAANPTWTWLNGNLALNSVGTLVADPNDSSGNTLYLGTGEANRCSSGCESGVGIYRSTNGGDSWTKLADSCVSNSTYSCVNSGDAFLGRAVSSIVIDPTNAKHIFVGLRAGRAGPLARDRERRPGPARAGRQPSRPVRVERRRSDVHRGLERQRRGLVRRHRGRRSTRSIRRPCTRRRSTRASGGGRRRWTGPRRSSTSVRSSPRSSPGAGRDRTMFAATVKNATTRVYLLDGTANAGTTPGNFWRTDNADQSAAALLASQAPGSTVPPGDGNPFPATYNGWQVLTAQTTASPYYATDDTCTGQCWYDEVVYTPAGMPDTVYVIGSYNYGELPCNTKGVGCGNGRSNGRAVIYSTTAGDPDASAAGTAVNRTFTDLTYDTQDQATATWCGLGPAGELRSGASRLRSRACGRRTTSTRTSM